MTIRGASRDVVEAAIERGNPFPGTVGFAGELDGHLVRDVLGRYPLYFDPTAPSNWSFDPDGIEGAELLPAGHLHTGSQSNQIWELPDIEPRHDREEILEALETAFERAFASVPREGLAIAFSGGIDSALLAATLDAPLYTVGFPDSHDIEAARSAANELDRELTVIELDHELLEESVPEVVRAIGRTNAMDVQIALPLLIVAEEVHADGFDALALGQGADELFGGYAKVARAPDDPRVAADTIRGARREVLQSLPAQLERDGRALRHAGVQPILPLLGDEIIEAALGLPGDLLVNGEGTRKVALREVARRWLPQELAMREKKAMQYGSLVSRELDRLAREAGYKRRMDDHVTQYIERLSIDPT